MADKKRRIEGYEVIHAVQLGGGEVIFAEKTGDAESPYMVCDCSWDNPLGVDVYSNAMGSADFVEIMKLFAHRLSERVIALETERETRGIPFQTVTGEDCHPAGQADLEGCIVVIRPEKLAPEYRTIDHQLALCTGGFGASPNSRGRAVFCKNLITGKSTQWNRDDIMGIVPEERLPDWARVNLAALRESADIAAPGKPESRADSAEKESVLEKIKQDRQSPKKQPKPKNKKQNKSGPEL